MAGVKCLSEVQNCNLTSIFALYESENEDGRDKWERSLRKQFIFGKLEDEIVL